MARRYELKERARAQQATRRRIVDATVALHREVGPARTTVAEVARRAGVGRVTVYNHFPDEVSLLGACSAQWVAENPPPDPAGWAEIENPAKRLRRALAELYAYFGDNEAMLANITRDAPLVPALAEALGAAGAADHERAMRAALLSGRALKGGRGRRTAAAVGLAVSFSTWHRLAREEGLEDPDAVKLMVRAIEAP